VTQRGLVRLAGGLLVGGQIVAIIVGRFHAGGGEMANQHAAVFKEYAASDVWTAAHIGLFASGLLIVAGLVVLCRALARAEVGQTLVVLIGSGAVLIAAAEGLVLAVDGVALKQTVDAWVNAAGPEKALAFHDAEVVRWLEWGVLSFRGLVRGVTFILLGLAIGGSVILPKWLGWMSVVIGLCFLAAGVVVGHEGFSDTLSPVGVTAYVLTPIFAIGIAVSGWRGKEPGLTETAAPC
jgi:hypothetical protein